MTKEEAIQDYIREVQDHDYSIIETRLGNNVVKNILLHVTNKKGKEFLVVAIDAKPEFESHKASIDLKHTGDVDDLVDYSWLFMRTAILLQDLERIGVV